MGWPLTARRPARRGRARRGAPDRPWSRDSTTVLLYKLARAAVDARPGPSRDRRRHRQLPDRPLRARGHRRRARAACCAGSRPTRPPASRPSRCAAAVGDRTRRWCCSATSPTGPAGSPTPRRSPDRARGRRATLWDLCHSVGSVRARAGRLGRRPGRRLHLQVPQRRPRLARVRLRPARPAGRAAAADPGLDGAARRRSRWDRATSRRRASGRLVSGTPPILAMVPLQANLDVLEEAGGRGGPGQVGGADRLRPRARRRLAGPARRRGGLAARRRSAAGATSRCSGRACATARRAVGARRAPGLPGPDGIRIGPAPLSTSFTELYRGLSVLREVLADVLGAGPPG